MSDPPHLTPCSRFFSLFQHFLPHPAHILILLHPMKQLWQNPCLFKPQTRSNKSWFLNTLCGFSHLRGAPAAPSLNSIVHLVCPLNFCHPKNILAGLHSTLKLLPHPTKELVAIHPGLFHARTHRSGHAALDQLMDVPVSPLTMSFSRRSSLYLFHPFGPSTGQTLVCISSAKLQC